jgi:hypothetical protein
MDCHVNSCPPAAGLHACCDPDDAVTRMTCWPGLPPLLRFGRDNPFFPAAQQVICWVLGEYGHTARRPPGAVLAALMGLLSARKAPTDRLRASLLTALAKLAAHTGGAAGPVGQALARAARGGGAGGGGSPEDPAAFMHACLSSQNCELQQRAYELSALLR